MILPTKYVRPEHSLLGAGASLLRHLSVPTTVSTLWEKTRGLPGVPTYERFVLALDLLFMLDAIEDRDGRLVKADR